MKTVEYVSLMRSIAKEKARAMAKEKGVKGIILVGSVAKGNATEISDVDLFCVGDFKYRRQKEKLKDIVCDVSFFPTSFFQKAFEESNLFQKGSKIDWLRHGIVLYDPNGILGELK
jgi:predicted nucleotidyltransferase